MFIQLIDKVNYVAHEDVKHIAFNKKGSTSVPGEAPEWQCAIITLDALGVTYEVLKEYSSRCITVRVVARDYETAKETLMLHWEGCPGSSKGVIGTISHETSMVDFGVECMVDMNLHRIRSSFNGHHVDMGLFDLSVRIEDRTPSGERVKDAFNLFIKEITDDYEKLAHGSESSSTSCAKEQ